MDFYKKLFRKFIGVFTLFTGGSSFCYAKLAGVKIISKIPSKPTKDLNYSYNQTKNLSLHSVVKENKLDLLKLILENSTSLNAKDESGETALHLAAWHKHLKATQFLLETGAKINSTTNDHETVFHFAVNVGNQTFINLLIENGAGLSAGDAERNTPLYLAVEKGDLQSVKLLLNRSHNCVNCKNSFGDTPLLIATKNSFPKISDELFKSGAKVNCQSGDGRIPVQLAIVKGHFGVVKLLLHHQTDVKFCDDAKNSCLHLAVDRYQKKMLNLVLQYAASKDLKKSLCEMPLHRAVLQNNVDARRRTSLHLAVLSDDLKMVETLLEYGADVDLEDSEGNSPIHLAVQGKVPKILELLLEKSRRNLNRQNLEGRTPLELAVLNSNAEAVSVLMNYEADINISFYTFLVPVQKEIEELCQTRSFDNSKGRFVELFLDLERKYDKFRTTALHLAVEMGNYEVAVVLLWRVRADVQDFDGETPLHVAVRNGDLKMLRCLLRKGANANLKNRFGDTPLDIAARSDNSVLRNWCTQVAKY